MPYVQVPDCEMYYEVTGAGPALLFAHGLGGNHLSWWQQVPWFADRYTCVTFAHRGYWPSRTGAGGPDPTRFGADLAALIDHLGFADVRLVGQSMGGIACLDYAIQHPERVRALVLASTVGGLTHPEVDRQMTGYGEAARPALLDRGIQPAAGERMAREQPALHFLYKGIEALNADLDRATLRHRMAAAHTVTTAHLAALPVPVLCVVGDTDVVRPPDALALVADLIPGARLERVPGAGHSVHFECPELFNRLVDGFLTAVGDRRA